MHIACTADEKYVPHCAAMLASLFEHNDASRTCVHYLHPADFPLATRRRLQEFVSGYGAQIQFHAFDDDVIAGLPSWPGLRPVMWYRVMLPERLPRLDRVLYIDADTLVLDDLSQLWNMDLEGNYLAAVTNVAPPVFADHPLQLGLPDRASYFNSGVMLLNLSRMRAEGSAGSMIAYGRAHPLRWWDQDALNVFFHRERIPLHPRWNCMNCVFLFPEARAVFGGGQVSEAIARPGIVHFEGPGLGKPWHYLSKHPFKSRYVDYRNKTPWPLVGFEGRTLHNFILRHCFSINGVLRVTAFEFHLAQGLRKLQRRVTREFRRVLGVLR